MKNVNLNELINSTEKKHKSFNEIKRFLNDKQKETLMKIGWNALQEVRGDSQ